MVKIKRDLVITTLVLLCSTVNCKRISTGGRYRPSHSYSSSRISHSPSAPPRPSYPSPAPRPLGFDPVRPSGGGGGAGSNPISPPVHSAPNYGFSSSNTHPAPPIGFKSPTASAPQGQPSFGFGASSTNVKPSAPLPEHPTNVKPLGSSNSGASPPSYGFNTNAGTSSGGASPPPYGFKPSAPVGPPTNVKPVGNTATGGTHYPVQPPYNPHYQGIPPPAYNPAHNPAGYGPPPAYNPAGYGHPPAYNPAGYGPPPTYNQQPHYGGYGHQTPYHGAAPGGFTNVNINNYNTNHHYGGTNGLGGYGGFGGGGFGGYSYPSYKYSVGNVGSGALGFFLGYSLAKVTTPSFLYQPSTFSGGYIPKYDHYEVHHYYHNRDTVPAQSTIQPNAIVGCVGDSGTICPSGTTSLCTTNGAILCVASATSTTPCTDQKQGDCVRTIIPCVNGTSGDCSVGQNQTLTIPCISKAKVMGNITYVNNTIIVNNTTIINNNGTTNTTTTTNSTTAMIDMSTTLPSNIVSDSNNTRNKRDTVPPTAVQPVNEFCVTILALPAERKPTDQERLFDGASNLFKSFLVKTLGADRV